MFELVAACLLLAAEPASAPPEPPAATTEPASSPVQDEAKPPVEAAPAAPGAPGEKPAVEVVPAAAALPAGEQPIAASSDVPADPDAPLRVTASLGFQRSWPGGLIDSISPMNDLTSPIYGVRLDFGFRITRHWMVAIVADTGVGGTPGWRLRAECGLDGVECAVSSTRMALEGRYVFAPTARRTWWVGAGLGGETTRVTLKDSKETRSFLPTYTGGIFPRLSGGWDRRVNRWFGWGLHGAISSGRYTKQSMGDSKTTADLPGDPRGHSWLDLGVRIILFP